MKRYDWLITHEDGHLHEELGVKTDGNYVLYDDIKHLREPMTKEEAERLIENVMRLREDGLSYKLSLDYKILIAALTGKEE